MSDQNPADQEDLHRYDDIIGLPHHVSSRHPPMSPRQRAMQFASFKALSGYEAKIEEEGRRTEQKTVLDEEQSTQLDRKLRCLERALAEGDRHPEVTVTYFRPDERKAGGAYFTVCRRVKKLDAVQRKLILYEEEAGGQGAAGLPATAVPLDDIRDLDGDLFRGMEAGEQP